MKTAFYILWLFERAIKAAITICIAAALFLIMVPAEQLTEKGYLIAAVLRVAVLFFTIIFLRLMWESNLINKTDYE